jgi:hypothetical protein
MVGDAIYTLIFQLWIPVCRACLVWGTNPGIWRSRHLVFGLEAWSGRSPVTGYLSEGGRDLVDGPGSHGLLPVSLVAW